MTREEAIKILEEIIDEGWLISDFDKCPAIDACEMAIEALEQESRWISVSERFPEKNGSYLVQVASSDGTATITFMMVEHYNEDGMWLHCDNKRRKVVAWMPLPEPYKARGEETDG